MTGDFEIHESVGVGDDEGRAYKDTEEFVAGEALVLPRCMGCFPLRHALEAFEDDAGVMGDDDAVVTELAEEATIATIDRIRYGTDVADVVVERVAVDVVDGVACRDLAFEGDVLYAGEVYRPMFSAKAEIPCGILLELLIRKKPKLNLSVGGINVVRAGM